MSDTEPFPIVGIGASAGGLQALEGFFRHTPPDTGIAFIVVTHLARDRVSNLCEILGRYTAMPVALATDGGAIEPNHIYCNSPDQIMTVEGGRTRLRTRESSGQHKPIDVFLSSLASDRGAAAVGILLSGSGSDGALGFKSIKEHGGFTLAQGADGSGPQYSEMPDAAIASEVVDLVVPVEEMGERLADYARRFTKAKPTKDEQGEQVKGYQAIYQLLHQQVGHDFSGYKERTFDRRVRRRMQVTQVDDLSKYVGVLRADTNEVNLLFRDLLIGVTNFFRDKDAFGILEKEIIPKLFEGKGVNDAVRIWVPGCATGEEVYSIGILVREHIEKLKTVPKIQIFATDIDEAALTIARSARYPATLLDNVSPDRLKRYFNGDDASYAVSKEIRDLCVFSPHSVLRDPPFSRMDLISCRNLLIYLGSDFQSQVIPVFHFALRPRGYLFLGTSENVSQHGDLFAPVDKKQRIFQRRDHVLTPLQLPSLGMNHARAAPTATAMRREPAGLAVNLRRVVDTWVMERFAPAHVVVDREGDILHYSPRTGKYLEPASGLPNRQLLAMARRGLRVDLRSAFRDAVDQARRVERLNIIVELEDRVQRVDVIIEPLSQTDNDPLFLVVFRDIGQPIDQIELESQQLRSGGEDPNLHQLERDLRDSRERLQATIEEYETAVEELKSSNEELQSVNEELQSTNEELETSKEELQSLNEELHTVNSELNAKVEEVDRANADLRNIFDSTRIATIFLDEHLVIRSFTPAVTDIFNLISTDRGRPLTDIVSALEDGELRRDVRAVFERGETIERNVRRADKKAHYLMRILPYRGHNNIVEGVVLTFVEVTKMIEAETHQRTLVRELNHRVRNMLAVVNAIARQTLKRSQSTDSFVEAFTDRIRAMGDAFTLVSDQNWSDVSLHDVVKTQLDPFLGEQPDRVRLQGGDIQLNPTDALSVGLITHELATNAAKYGALSVAKGRVTVGWARKGNGLDGGVELVWREDGGPPAKSPDKRGFGSELIEREIQATLNGSVSFDYGPTGLTATMSLRLNGNSAS